MPPKSSSYSHYHLHYYGMVDHQACCVSQKCRFHRWIHNIHKYTFAKRKHMGLWNHFVNYMKTLKYKSRAPNPWQQLHGKTGESGARAPISESRLCCQYLTWNHIHTCLRVDSEGEQDKCSPIQKTTHQLLLSARTNMGNMDLTTGLEICCREMPMMFVRRNEADIVSVEALPPPC